MKISCFTGSPHYKVKMVCANVITPSQVGCHSYTEILEMSFFITPRKQNVNTELLRQRMKKNNTVLVGSSILLCLIDHLFLLLHCICIITFIRGLIEKEKLVGFVEVFQLFIQFAAFTCTYQDRILEELQKLTNTKENTSNRNQKNTSIQANLRVSNLSH